VRQWSVGDLRSRVVQRKRSARLSTNRLGRQPALDGLRGLAVLAVVLAHFELVSGFGSGGIVGVDMFFCLSGFLITALLLDEHHERGRISLSAFYRRRAARLLPAMLVFVSVTVLIVAITGVDREATLRAVPAVLVYVENWWAAPGRDVGALGHMWSLSIEEQFYLIWPAVVVLALRGRRGALVLVAILGVAWALIDRERSCAGGVYCVYHVYMATDTRMDQLLLGSLLAIGFHRGALAYVEEKAAAALGWLALGFLVAFAFMTIPWNSHLYDTVGMTGTALLTCIVMGSVLRCPGGRLATVLSWRPLRAVGLVSYGIYLWDGLFLVLLRDGTSLGQYQRAVLIVALTAGAAVLSWRFIERPILARAKVGTGLRAAAEELDSVPRSYETVSP